MREIFKPFLLLAMVGIASFPVAAYSQASGLTWESGTVLSATQMNNLDKGKINTTSGASTNQTLTTPTITGGTATSTNVSASVTTATGSTASRTLAARGSDIRSSLDFGVVGDGTTDDGPDMESAINASVKKTLLIPYSSSGYLLTTGTFAGGDYPNYSYDYSTDPSVYPSVSEVDYGNSYIHGTAAGSPDSCTGTVNSPYTQPCLAVTGRRTIVDPASVFEGPSTTNAAISIEMLPNHKSSNASNLSNGYYRNWTTLFYFAADTGNDGQPNSAGTGFGSTISTELANWALNVNTNSGIGEEFDVNVINAVQDGGITRGQFMLSSAAFKGEDSIIAGHSPWGIGSAWAESYEVNATPFTTTTKPATQTNGNGETVYTSSTSGSTTTYTVYPRWTRAYSASGAVDDFVGAMNVSGESGNLLRGLNASGADFFTIDKSGNLTTNGYVSVKDANVYVSDGRYCLDASCTRYVYEVGSEVKIGNSTNGDVMSIDDSGNMTIKGTLTQSGTP